MLSSAPSLLFKILCLCLLRSVQFRSFTAIQNSLSALVWSSSSWCWAFECYLSSETEYYLWSKIWVLWHVISRQTPRRIFEMKVRDSKSATPLISKLSFIHYSALLQSKLVITVASKPGFITLVCFIWFQLLQNFTWKCHRQSSQASIRQDFRVLATRFIFWIPATYSPHHHDQSAQASMNFCLEN